MAYAILTETTEFTRSFEPADLQAYLELLPRANLRLIGDIRNAPLPPAYFAQLREALDRARVYGRTVWSELDEVLQPEIVAEIADRLVRMERITWCFCAARHGTRLLLSLRSNRPGARCGQTLRRVIGRAGSGGGHDRLAAGYVELAGLSPDAAAARRRRIITQLVRRLERRMATDGDPLEFSRPLLAPAAAEKSDDAPTSPDS